MKNIYKNIKKTAFLIIIYITPFPAVAATAIITPQGGKIFIGTNSSDSPFSKPDIQRDRCPTNRCSPTDLKNVDDELNDAYNMFNEKLSKDSIAKLKNEQIAWLANRDKECAISYSGTDKEKWFGHILMNEARTICVMRLSEQRSTVLLKRLVRLNNIRLDNSSPYFQNRLKSDLIEDYWLWVEKFPKNKNPSSDKTGKLCSSYQSGGVWFLTGSTSSKSINRHCKIPANTALVVPAINALIKGPKKELNYCNPQMISAMDRTLDNASNFTLTIDGIDFNKNNLNRVSTNNCINMNNSSIEAYGDGYWAFIEPLSTGKHTLSIGAQLVSGFSQDIHYELDIESECSFEKDLTNTDIIAIGSEKGINVEDFRIGKNNVKTYSSDVVVNSPNKPVLLVLSSHSSVWWKIAKTKNTEIHGVVLAGSQSQAVTGIKSDIPIVRAIRNEKGNCPSFYGYRSLSRHGTHEVKLDEMPDKIRQLTGKKPKEIILEPIKDRYIIGSTDFLEDDLIVEDDYSINDYDIYKDVLPGEKGINQLVAEGRLRIATNADIEQWESKAQKTGTEPQNVRPSIRLRTPFHDSYVILKKITIPADMYGSHSRMFLIPENVPKPNYLSSHNQYYDIKTGKCIGSKGKKKCFIP